MTLSAHGSPVHSCNVLALWWRDALPDQLVAVAPRVTYGHTDRSQEILRFTGPPSHETAVRNPDLSQECSHFVTFFPTERSPHLNGTLQLRGVRYENRCFLGGYRRLMGPRIASAG
jgi:hypothetical protein